MIAVQIFSSTGFGFLVGIMMGLSTSPVVGIVVGALAALIAGYFGLTAKKSADKNDMPYNSVVMNSLRIGFFCFSCVAGIVSGIYSRTHNLLSPAEPSLKEQVLKWMTIGITEEEARSLVIYHTIGILPATDMLTANKTKPSKVASDSSKSVLFSNDTNICEKININNFATVKSALEYYKNIEMNSLANLAETTMKHVEKETVRKEIIKYAVEALCAAKK